MELPWIQHPAPSRLPSLCHLNPQIPFIFSWLKFSKVNLRCDIILLQTSKTETFICWDTELLAYPGDQQHFSNNFRYLIHTHSGAVGSYESPVWVYVVTLWREEQPLLITPRDGDDLARMPVAQHGRKVRYLLHEPDVQDQQSIIPAADAIVRAVTVPFVTIHLGLSVCPTL